MKEKECIRDHWTRNVPGLDIGLGKRQVIDKDFFTEVDNFRKVSEPYVPAIMDGFAKKGRKVLEVGCGIGYDSRELARRGMVTVSCDLSFENVHLTKEGFELSGLAGDFVNLDAEHLPFKDNTFDVFYSFGVLHHTPNTRQAIEEAWRVLKPGGQTVIMLYHKGYAYLYIMIIKGWFFLKRLFMSEAELISKYYDFTPLSKMYSKRQAQELFAHFSEIKFEVTTNGFGGVVHKNLKWLHFLFHRFPFLLHTFGSFLIIKATKTDDGL